MAKAKAKAKVAPKVEPKVEVEPVAPVVEVKEEPVVTPPVKTKVEPKVVQKSHGPFINGSSDNAFDEAMRWAVDTNASNHKVTVSHNRDSNNHEAWVTYETTE
jgi:hypothetical protein